MTLIGNRREIKQCQQKQIGYYWTLEWFKTIPTQKKKENKNGQKKTYNEETEYRW